VFESAPSRWVHRGEMEMPLLSRLHIDCRKALGSRSTMSRRSTGLVTDAICKIAVHVVAEARGAYRKDRVRRRENVDARVVTEVDERWRTGIRSHYHSVLFGITAIVFRRSKRLVKLRVENAAPKEHQTKREQ